MREIDRTRFQEHVQNAEYELGYRNPEAVALSRIHQSLAGIIARLSDERFQMYVQAHTEVLEHLHLASRKIASEYSTDIHDPSPIPPFHLRDMEDDWVYHDLLEIDGEYTIDFEVAQEAARQAAISEGMPVQICNLYSNTVFNVDPDEAI